MQGGGGGYYGGPGAGGQGGGYPFPSTPSAAAGNTAAGSGAAPPRAPSPFNNAPPAAGAAANANAAGGPPPPPPMMMTGGGYYGGAGQQQPMQPQMQQPPTPSAHGHAAAQYGAQYGGHHGHGHGHGHGQRPPSPAGMGMTMYGQPMQQQQPMQQPPPATPAAFGQQPPTPVNNTYNNSSNAAATAGGAATAASGGNPPPRAPSPFRPQPTATAGQQQQPPPMERRLSTASSAGSAAELFASAGPANVPSHPQGPPTQTQTQTQTQAQIHRVPSHASYASSQGSFDQHDHHDSAMGPGLTAAASLFSSGITSAASGAATLFGSAQKKVATVTATTATSAGNINRSINARSVGNVVQSVKSAGAAITSNVTERGVSGSILGMVEQAGMAPPPAAPVPAPMEPAAAAAQGGEAAAVPAAAAAGQQGELLVEDLGDSYDDDEDANGDDGDDGNANGANGASNGALQEGWEEIIDETSGQPYYYNSTTGETSWDRPIVAVTTTTTMVVEDTPVEATPVDVAPVAVAAAEPEPEQAPAPQEEVAPVAEIAPQPAPEPIAEPAAAPSVSDAPMGEERLQDGWEEIMDEANGMPYYYNSATGETTWDRPVAPPTATWNAAPPTAALTAAAAAEEPAHVAEQTAEPEPVPEPVPAEAIAGGPPMAAPGIVAAPPSTAPTELEFPPQPASASDVVAGGVATASREAPTVTLLPAETESEIGGGEAVPEFQPKPVETAVKDDAPASVAALAPGWEELYDEGSGQPYYYNSTTGETSWEKPVVDEGSAVNDVAPPPIATEEEDIPTQDTAAPSTVEESAPPDVDVPASVEEIAEVQAPIEAEPEVDVAEEMSEPSPVAEPVTEPAALDLHVPEGWQAFTDPGGQTYYYNQSTGETSWDKPAIAEAVPEQAAADIAAEAPPLEASVEPALDEPAPTTQAEPEPAQVPEPEPVEPTMVPSTPAPAQQQLPPAAAAFSAPPKQSVEVASTPSQEGQPGPAEHSRQVQSAARPPISSTMARARLNLPLPSKRTLNVPSRTPRQPGQGVAPSTGASSIRRRFRLPPPSIKSTATPSQEENITVVPTPKEAVEPLPTKTPHNTPAFDVDYIEDTGEGPSLELPGSSAPAPGASGTEAPAAAPTAPIPTPALPPRGPIVPSMTPAAGAQPESTVEAAAAALSQPFKIEKKLSFSSATAQEEHAAQVGGGPDELEEDEEKEDDIVAVDKSAQPPQEGTEAFVAGVVASEILDEAIGRVIDTPAAATGEAEDTVGGAGGGVPEATGAAPTLPVGWQELTDPSSGQLYFYNSETGATSWDRPAVADAPAVEEEEEATSPAAEESGGATDAVQQQEPPPQTEASEETVGSGSSWEVVDGGADLKEAEIKPSEDDGVPLENNSDDGWAAANPEAEGATENAGEGAASSGPTEQSELPSGWIQVIDETSGDPYYFNENTGESSWEKPPIDADDSPAEPGSDEPVPEAAAVAPATTEETAPTADEAEVIVGDDSELPEGWSEQTTEDGERYYFNEHTGESSWQSPPSNPKDNVAAAVDASIPVSETEYESAPTSDDGWQTVKEAPVPEDKGAPDDAETESLRALSTKQDIGSSPPPSVSELDAMMPGAMSQNADTETIEEENDEPRPEPEPAQDTGGLPPGWLECTDPEGNTYYFNDLTGQSSWERPQGGTTGDAPEPAETESAVDDAETESLRALSVKRDVGASPPPSVSELDGMVEVPPTEGEDLAVQNETSAPVDADAINPEPAEAEVPGKEEVAPLPEPWVELMTDAGEPYYYNQEDGTTSWERPQAPLESAVGAGDDIGGAAQKSTGATGDDTAAELNPTSMDDIAPQGETQPDSEPEPVSSEAEQRPQTLPENWTEETTDAGEVYYYNTETGATQWDRPVSEDATVEDSQIGGAQSTDEFVHVEKEPEISEDGAPSAVANTAGDSDELPAPWEMLYTPEGEAYYFNQESGETSWDKPLAPSAPSGPVDYRTSAASAAAAAAAASTSNTASSQVELRPRPAHAIASFGFGGRLSVMHPQQATSLMGGPTPAGGGSVGLRRGPVVIHTLKDILDTSDAALSGDPSSTNGQFQPMITMNEADAFQRIEEKASSENASLLWNLILIASKWNGRLRSINGPNDPNSPEAAIVQLLLDSDNMTTSNDNDQQPAYAMPSPMKVGADGVDSPSAQQGGVAVDLEDIQNHLIRGQREEAVARAVSSKNYALAFLIAAMCDRETYHAVAQKFVDDALQSGTPLHTCCSLFSGQMVPPDDMQLDRTGEKLSCFSDASLNLSQTWKFQLAGILSNRTAGWEHIILALGDRLLQLGDVCPAHFCYMVCGCSITDPSHPMTRLSLVGCDHVIPEHIGLLTREGVESYERTEAFEWAKRRGNPNAAIPALQQFKLTYAKRLADHGLMREAKSHVDIIRHCTGLGTVGDERDEARKRRYYSEKFEEELDIFEDRVCFVLGIPSSMEKRLEEEKKKGAVSRALENMSSVFSKGLSKPATTDSDAVAAVGKQSEQRDESSVGGGADDPDSSFVSAVSMPTTGGAPPSAARVGAGIGIGGMAPIEEDAAQQSFEPPQQQQQQLQQTLLSPVTGSNNRPDDDMSFVSATSHVLDTTGATFKSAHPHPTTTTGEAEAEGAPPPMMGADPFAAVASFSASASASAAAIPPSAAAAAAASPFGHQPAGGFPVPTKEPAPASEPPMPVASTPAPKTAPAGPLPDASFGMTAQATNKPPKSDPVVLEKPADKTTETPSSKSGWSLRNFITKTLNPDATVADLGDSGKMVFSEEHKVWYVEGQEDPAELAKARAPPPPPTMSMSTPSTPAAPATPAADPSDPLAALMAPAGLRVPSRSTPAGMGRPPSGMPGMPPTGNMMMGATPVAKNSGGGKGGAAVPPPTFSVFTPAPGPTPAKTETEKREEDAN